MNTLTYGENRIELFRYLKRHKTERIFSNMFQVVFDYEDSHIVAFPEGFIAASQKPNN
jgi:hypothetical protein